MKKHHKKIVLLNDYSFYNDSIFYRLFPRDTHDILFAIENSYPSWQQCINKKNIENCDVIIIKTQYLFGEHTNYKIISYNREENKYLFDFFPLGKTVKKHILRKLKRYSKTFYILTYKKYD